MSNSTVFVYTMNKIGAVGAWSRYVFPFAIEDTTIFGSSFMVRDGDSVRSITDTVEYDEVVGVGETEAPWTKQYFDAVVQWAHLDFGTPGKDKEMIGFDIVGTGAPSVQFGWNQKDVAALTTAYEVDEDTLTDDIIAMPLTAPTISVKITYVGVAGKFWQLNSVNLYIAD